MYEPSKHVGTFKISGAQHWDAAKVLGKLKVGDKIDLVAEPDNPYDPNAVALYAHGAKLGYFPAEHNELISLFMYYGHPDVLEARLLKVDPEADPWDQLRFGLYVTDARRTNDVPRQR